MRITRCAHARETESCTVRVSPLFLLFYLLFGVVHGLFCVIKFESSRNARYMSASRMNSAGVIYLTCLVSEERV